MIDRAIIANPRRPLKLYLRLEHIFFITYVIFILNEISVIGAFLKSVVPFYSPSALTVGALYTSIVIGLSQRRRVGHQFCGELDFSLTLLLLFNFSIVVDYFVTLKTSYFIFFIKVFGFSFACLLFFPILNHEYFQRSLLYIFRIITSAGLGSLVIYSVGFGESLDFGAAWHPKAVEKEQLLIFPLGLGLIYAHGAEVTTISGEFAKFSSWFLEPTNFVVFYSVLFFSCRTLLPNKVRFFSFFGFFILILWSGSVAGYVLSILGMLLMLVRNNRIGDKFLFIFSALGVIALLGFLVPGIVEKAVCVATEGCRSGWDAYREINIFPNADGAFNLIPADGLPDISIVSFGIWSLFAFVFFVFSIFQFLARTKLVWAVIIFLFALKAPGHYLSSPTMCFSIILMVYVSSFFRFRRDLPNQNLSPVT